jgi:hypothetical protein
MGNGSTGSPPSATDLAIITAGVKFFYRQRFVPRLHPPSCHPDPKLGPSARASGSELYKQCPREGQVWSDWLLGTSVHTWTLEPAV